MNKIKSAGILAILLGLLLIHGTLNAQKVLFKSNFTDLDENWEVVNDPTADNGPGQWRVGLVELSGLRNSEYTMAAALLTGEKNWQNYTVETSLTMAGAQGYLTGIVCGYQDPTHFYFVGYNFYEHQFELRVRSPEGFELLDFFDVYLIPNVEVPLRLDYAGGRLRFTADGHVVFDLNDERYPSGQFGLGSSGLLGSKVMFGPVTVHSVDPSDLPPRELQDLLSFQRGAEVVSEAEKSSAKCLIDHGFSMETKEFNYGSYMSLTLKRVGLPFEAVYAFPQGKAVEIHSIGLEMAEGYFPKDVEFLVAQENTETSFKSAGVYEFRPEKNSYQEFEFGKIKARYLKVRFLSADKENYLQLNEMRVKGYREGSGLIPGAARKDPAAGKGEVLFQDDFSSGSIDKWQVWQDPGVDDKKSQWMVVLSEFSGIYNYLDHPATFLVTGESNWADYSVESRLFAAQSDGDLSGLVFGFKGKDDYYIAGYNFQHSRFELGMQTPFGFEVLARARVEYPRNQWRSLRVDVNGSRIQFRYDGRVIFDLDDGRTISGRVGIGTSALDYGVVNFDSFKVTSTAETSLPKKEMQDLLSGRRGAAVIYKEIPPKSEAFDDLLDHPLMSADKYGNTYRSDLSQDKLPQEVVFCFPQGRFVEIHGIGFRFARQDQPQEMKLWVSNQTPRTGFSELTTITFQPGSERSQEFPVMPTRAKYLKMQILKATGSKYVEINEMYAKGYYLERADRQPGEEVLGEVQLREKEPNDTAGQAQKLPLGAYLGGEVAQDDFDYYRLALKDKPGNTLTLYLNNLGVLRPGYVLLRLDGTQVQPAAETAVGNLIEVTYQVAPEDHLLRIFRPESFLTIVFDDSGSMGPSVDIVKKILGGYLDNLGEGLSLKLMKYEDEPTHLSDFTYDADLLKQAIEKEVRGGGGTDTFKGLLAAVDSVSLKDGNRAVLAIFDVIDCGGDLCMQHYSDLWNKILESGISFSTIAVQKGWDSETRYYANTRQRIFKEIAYASQGEYYYSPSPEKVEESADRIFRQLTSPVKYRLKAELSQTKKKSGDVEVKFEAGAEKQAAKNVELILDASNSMWGQIEGTAKITIAKEVLKEIVGGLPDEMNVGLRLYGHRYGLKDSRACQDTELVTPIGLINKVKLKTAVDAITPRGKTPLVYSVLEGINDFEGIGSGTIVLVSDGVESCEGDIDSIAPALKAAGLDLQVNIVGFDIKEVKARQQLEAIAASTGGIYLDAKDSEQLLDSLEQTLKVEFVLLDNQGGIKARGVVGEEPVQVLEGTYTMKLLLQPEPLEIRIVVNPDSTTRMTLKKEGEQWTLK